MLRNYIPVSVIIPCYLCTETIARAVHSIWEQTVLPMEVLLIEDCSPDNGLSFHTLQMIADKYPDGWIKVIGLELNKGPGNARNIGWDSATGEYLAFLDADDSWHPKKLEIQYEFMKNNPVYALSGHLCKKWDGVSIPDRKCDAKRISFRELLYSNKFPTRTVMLKRNLPFRFRSEQRYSEDYYLWLQILAEGFSGCVLDVTLAYDYEVPNKHTGLSSNLWQMEKGEISNYRALLNKRQISYFTFFPVVMWSFLKYIRRNLVHLRRNLIV